MYNRHLLQIEHTVAEYQAILREEGNVWYIPSLAKAPEYTIARCPFCQHDNTERLDTYSLERWHRRIGGGTIGEVMSHCGHFALAGAFVNFQGSEPTGLNGEFPAEVPYVIGHLLERGLCQAVIHALPICRIDEHDQFIPAYTAFLVTHFSQHERKFIREKVVGFNVDFVEEGLAIELIDPPPGYEQWYDLAHWVERGLLWWVDAGDPALPIRTGDSAAMPYKNIAGRMLSHQFLLYAGPSYRYNGPRR
jgi:hypothetical protein